MTSHPLDYTTRKALCVHLGETAGREIADLMLKMSRRIEELERGKVSVTRIVPQEGSGIRGEVGSHFRG